MSEQAIGSRFSALIKELKMTNNSFAKSLNKSSTTINYIVDGKSKPSFDVLESVFTQYPQVNPDWLLKGRGEMFQTEQSNKSADAGQFGDQVLLRILDELHVIKEQVTIKDRQIEGMQRTIDALLSRPVAAANFPKPATGEAGECKVIEFKPAAAPIKEAV